MKKKIVPLTELKVARIKAGLSQADVGRMLKVSTQTVSNHETGKGAVTLLQLKVYSDIYGVADYKDLLPTPEELKKFYH